MKNTFLILSFTFLFFFLFIPRDTFALTSRTIRPDQMYSVSNVNSSNTTEGISTYNILNDTYYGHYFSIGNSYFAIGWYYSTYNNISFMYNDVYDLNFTIYHNLYQLPRDGSFAPLRVYISDQNNHQFTCDVTTGFSPEYIIGSNLQQTGGFLSNYSTVSCKNVNISSAFDVILVDTFNTTNGATIAISNLTATQTSNSTLNNIDDSINNTNDKLDDLNDNITNSDTSDSQSSAGSFFEDFTSDDYGLSDIITMPLTFIKGLSNASCYSLDLPFPFVEQNVQIPCMTSIYEKYFGNFLTLYQTITTGFIAYWVCVNIYRLVKNFKNPDDDKVEVMEL